MLGDFVKGDPNKYYSDSLSDGIRLHRFVDSYTDRHEVSRSAKSLFSNHPTRVFLSKGFLVQCSQIRQFLD